jgi:membrane protein
VGETPVADPPERVNRPSRWPTDVVRGVVRAFPRAVEDLFKDRCPQYAAAIAYHVLFSIVPLTILLVSAFALVLQDDAVRQDVINELLKVLPFSSAGIRKSVEQIATPWSAIGLISLIALLWGASGMMASIRLGLEATMKVERRRPAAHAKLLDFALVGTAGVLVLLVVALSAFAAFFGRVLDKGAEHLGINANPSGLLLRDVVQLVLIFTMAFLLYRFVPTRTELRSRDLLAGAVLTAVGIWGAAKIISLAFDFSHYNVIYGAALVVLLGSEFAYAWAQPPGPPGPPLRTQIWGAFRGLFVYAEDEDEERPTASRRP